MTGWPLNQGSCLSIERNGTQFNWIHNGFNINIRLCLDQLSLTWLIMNQFTTSYDVEIEYGININIPEDRRL